MRLGLCLPPRPLADGPSRVPPERWGCLRDPLHADIMARLRQEPGLELVEVEIRDGWSRNGEVFAGGHKLSELDGLFWYCEIDRSPGAYTLELLKSLSLQIPVSPDPWRWERALDKYTAHLALRRAGVPVPDFMLVDPKRPEPAMAAVAEWGAGLLKPRRGAWGKGVLLVDHPAAVRDIAGFLASEGSGGGGLLLERYLDNDLDRWASATVLGGRVLSAYRKRSGKRVALPGGRMKVYDADEEGGDVDPCPLDPRRRAVALAAAAALDCPVLGFDMIDVNGEPVVVDENTSPGNYPEVWAAAGVDAAAAWVNTITGGLS